MSPERISRRQALKGIAAAGAAVVVQRACGNAGVQSGALLPAGAADADATVPSEYVRDLNAGTSHLPYVTGGRSAGEPNFIVVMCDTLRYDHIGYHGNSAIQTPNIDAFASQALVFDRAYSGGFPTLLNRADLLTGRHTFTYMGWEDLHDEEVVLANVLNNAGYTTGIVFDTLHLKNNGFTFDRGYRSWQWIRGQEDDRYRVVPLAPELPASPSKFRHDTAVIEQYLRNVSDRQDETDYFCARTIEAAIGWIREIHDQNKFFLHIDAFDPHEPWDPPQSYVDLYDPGYVGEEVIYPAYAPTDFLSPAELEHVRALYAAEVTMVDHWLGELFAEIGRLGLWSNTTVILTSDHGILLGEHGLIGKGWDYQGHYECYPLYEELVRIPLMIRGPGITPRRITDLAQPADLMPTILDWVGAAHPSRVQGVSLVPTIEDATGSSHPPAHQSVVSCRSLFTPLSTKPSCKVTDGQWALVHGGGHAPSALYYLPNDPQEQTNVLDQHCDVALGLQAQFIGLLESTGTAATYLDPWRVPPCTA